MQKWPVVKENHTIRSQKCTVYVWNGLDDECKIVKTGNSATRYLRNFVLFYEVWELEMYQSAKVTFKVIQRHWHWCHSMGHIRFRISLPLQLCLCLAQFPRYYHLSPIGV